MSIRDDLTVVNTPVFAIPTMSLRDVRCLSDRDNISTCHSCGDRNLFLSLRGRYPTAIYSWLLLPPICSAKRVAPKGGPNHKLLSGYQNYLTWLKLAELALIPMSQGSSSSRTKR